MAKDKIPNYHDLFHDTEHASKKEAIRELKNRGYRDHAFSSESGDHGVGSREYYAKRNSEKNQFGIPLHTGSVSKVGTTWRATSKKEHETSNWGKGEGNPNGDTK